MNTDKLDKYREQISKLDEEIITLLIKRFELCDIVGQIKKENNISIENKDIEKIILAKLIDKTDQKLEAIFVQKIYKEIFEYSKDRQKKV